VIAQRNQRTVTTADEHHPTKPYTSRAFTPVRPFVAAEEASSQLGAARPSGLASMGEAMTPLRNNKSEMSPREKPREGLGLGLGLRNLVSGFGLGLGFGVGWDPTDKRN